MTSAKRTAANRRNALKSTGPRTPEGKRRTSMNALKHGLRAASMAVPVLEDPKDWETHRAQTVRDLTPVGYLETVFAERAAALLWRLARVVRYEAEVVSIAMSREATGTSYGGEEATESLKETAEWKEEDHEVLSRVHALKGKARVSGEDAAHVLGLAADYFGVHLYEGEEDAVDLDLPVVPEETPWEDFTGWTRDLVDRGVQQIATHARDRHPEWNEVCRKRDPWHLVTLTVSLEASNARKRYEQRAAATDRNLRLSLLPSDETLEKVTRYETTLERSLFRTLHELQRLQAFRSGMALPAPATLDVDVNVHQEAP